MRSHDEGLRKVSIGIGMMLAALLTLFIYVLSWMVIPALLFSLRRMELAFSLMQYQIMLGVPIIVTSSLLAAIGPCLCLAPPQESRSTTFILLSVVSSALALLTRAITLAFEVPGVVELAANGLPVLALFFFLLFVIRLADYLDRPSIVGTAKASLACSSVAIFCATIPISATFAFAMLGAGRGWMTPLLVIAILAGLFAVVFCVMGFLFYLRALIFTRRTLLGISLPGPPSLGIKLIRSLVFGLVVGGLAGFLLSISPLGMFRRMTMDPLLVISVGAVWGACLFGAVTGLAALISRKSSEAEAMDPTTMHFLKGLFAGGVTGLLLGGVGYLAFLDTLGWNPRYLLGLAFGGGLLGGFAGLFWQIRSMGSIPPRRRTGLADGQSPHVGKASDGTVVRSRMPAPPVSLGSILLTGFALCLWLALTFHLYVIGQLVQNRGQTMMEAVATAGLAWGIGMATGGLALWALSYWRRERDAFPTTLVKASSLVALLPLVVGLLLSLPTYTEALAAASQSSSGDAEVTLRIKRKYGIGSNGGSFEVEQERRNIRLSEAGGGGGTFSFTSNPAGDVSYRGKLHTVAPDQVEIEMEVDNAVPFQLNFEGLENPEVMSDSDGKLLPGQPIAAGSHQLTITGTVAETSWPGGAKPADFVDYQAPASGTYQGKPVSYWVEKLRRGVVFELRDGGPETLPIWEQAAADAEASTWVRHAFMFRDEPWEWRVKLALLSGNGTMKSFVLREFQELDPESVKVAVPRLTELAKQWAGSEDRTERRLAVSALSLILRDPSASKETVRLMIRLWPDADYFQRRGWLEQIATSGELGATALVDLQAGGKIDSSQLATVGQHADEETITGLLAELEAEQVSRRRSAVFLLATISRQNRRLPQQSNLLDPLVALLKDPDPEVQRQAVDALANLADEEHLRDILPQVGEMLGSQNAALRSAAAGLLAKARDPAWPLINVALQSDDEFERIGGALALDLMRPLPPSRLPVILELLEDESRSVQGLAVSTLGHVEEVNETVLDTLIGLLDDENLCYRALISLGNLGESAAPAVDRLEPLLTSKDIRLRLAVADACWKISGDAGLVLPVYRSLIRDEEGAVWNGTSYFNETVDGKRIQKRRSYASSASGEAARRLAALGPAAAPALPDVVALLDDGDSIAQSHALTALRSIGPDAASAAPKLLEFASQHPEMLSSVRYTLRAIDSKSLALLEQQANAERSSGTTVGKPISTSPGRNDVDLPLVFSDDFSGPEIDSAWKIENGIEGASVTQQDGVLKMNIPDPSDDYRNVRLVFRERLPRTDFVASVDFRATEGKAMSWLLAEDPGYSDQVYGTYFNASTSGYWVWRHNEDVSGSIGPVRPGFDDEWSQWHNLKLRYNAGKGTIRAFIDDQATLSLARFLPERTMIVLQIKHSSRVDPGPCRVEFDNFKLFYESEDPSGGSRGQPSDSDLLANLEQTRSLIAAGERSYSLWNRWSHQAFQYYQTQDWKGADQEADLAFSQAADSPNLLARVVYLYLLAGDCQGYQTVCDHLVQNVDDFHGQDLGQAAVLISLNPLPPQDPDATRQFTRTALERGPEYCANAKWLIDARLGNFEQAFEGYRAFKETHRIAGWPDFDLAIAHHLRGDQDAAQEWLDSSQQDFKTWDSGYPHHHFEIQVLKQEAERRILNNEAPSIDGWNAISSPR